MRELVEQSIHDHLEREELSWVRGMAKADMNSPPAPGVETSLVLVNSEHETCFNANKLTQKAFFFW